MRQMNRAGRRPTAAYFWARRALRLSVFGGIVGLLLAGLSFAKAPAFFPQVVGLPLMAAAVVAFLIAMLATIVRRTAEEQEGYTTSNGDARNLQQRNPYDGSVIRNAGEPYLPTAEFDAILAASRARRKQGVER